MTSSTDKIGPVTKYGYRITEHVVLTEDVYAEADEKTLIPAGTVLRIKDIAPYITKQSNKRQYFFVLVTAGYKDYPRVRADIAVIRRPTKKQLEGCLRRVEGAFLQCKLVA